MRDHPFDHIDGDAELPVLPNEEWSARRCKAHSFPKERTRVLPPLCRHLLEAAERVVAPPYVEDRAMILSFGVASKSVQMRCEVRPHLGQLLRARQIAFDWCGAMRAVNCGSRSQ